MSQLPLASPEELKEILDCEYQALLTGDLAEISRLASEKARALEHISNLPIEHFEDFAFLYVNMKRNQELAFGAISGMRNALSRVKAILNVNLAIGVYDAKGQKNDFSVRSGRALSKRF